MAGDVVVPVGGGVEPRLLRVAHRGGGRQGVQHAPDQAKIRFAGVEPDYLVALMAGSVGNMGGLPDAQLGYIAAFSEIHLPGAMGDPTFERWMEEVPTVMTRMLDAGHADAPTLFAEAYARDRWHGHLFPFDLMRSVAYGQLDQRIGNDRTLAARFVAIRRQALSPAQRAEADQMTAQLYAAHYAGRPHAKNEHRRHLLYSIQLDPGPSSTARDTLCQPHVATTEAR
ncbi:MAG: hypothetical protein HC794_06715 [Nitrospiraceae bacterium]|nr:hypothetical protein [Nitrospiraceae bacterium]